MLSCNTRTALPVFIIVLISPTMHIKKRSLLKLRLHIFIKICTSENTDQVFCNLNMQGSTQTPSNTLTVQQLPLISQDHCRLQLQPGFP
jgi:hypothetical protein